MKKFLLLSVAVLLSTVLFTSCKPGEQEQVSQFYKEVIYNFADGGNYFTADLKSCYGIQDISNPSIGTIHASIEIKANVGCYLEFKRLINGLYLTEYGIYPREYYHSSFSQVINMSEGQVTTLNLEFPDVPSTLARIGVIHIEVKINTTKTYSFDIHQIPYLPKTDRIVWN
ncbi:MAG: hypothetical protein WC395_04570 [Bacteroidales bacterium]|jgi:hypothetical protein